MLYNIIIHMQYTHSCDHRYGIKQHAGGGGGGKLSKCKPGGLANAFPVPKSPHGEQMARFLPLIAI